MKLFPIYGMYFEKDIQYKCLTATDYLQKYKYINIS